MNRKTRNSKNLGSLLGDYDNIKRRIGLSNAEMNSFAKVWQGMSLPLN